MSCEFEHLDGAYVLGALSRRERREFERHLAECTACSRAVGELAGLPHLLAQLSPADVEPQGGGAEVPLPTTLLPSLVREVRRAGRRRSLITSATAALAGAASVAGTLWLGQVLSDRAEAPGSTTAGGTAAAGGRVAATIPAARTLTVAGSGPVTADIALTTVLWGTRLDLTCPSPPLGETGSTTAGRSPAAAGAGGEEVYVLIVRTRQGVVQQVGTWRALPGRTMRLAAATSTRAADIAAVEVREPDGAVVATLAG